MPGIPDPITPVAKSQEPTPAPVQAPKVQPATPSPAAKVGVPPSPAIEDKVVPITALHEEREKRQQLQLEIDALKRVAGQNVLFDINGNAVQTQSQPQQYDHQEAFRQEVEKTWETDPRKAVQMEIMSALAWRDRQDAIVDAQENAVATKYSDFNDYRGEVKQYIRSLPIDQRGRDGVVELAYYVVKGQRVDNIVARTRQDIEADYLRKFQAGELAQGLPGGAASSPNIPQNSVVLNDQQRRACEALGITEMDYIKHMKR